MPAVRALCLEALPLEVLEQIINYLPVESVVALSGVSKVFWTLALSDRIWHPLYLQTWWNELGFVAPTSDESWYGLYRRAVLQHAPSRKLSNFSRFAVSMLSAAACVKPVNG